MVFSFTTVASQPGTPLLPSLSHPRPPPKELIALMPEYGISPTYLKRGWYKALPRRIPEPWLQEQVLIMLWNQKEKPRQAFLSQLRLGEI